MSSPVRQRLTLDTFEQRVLMYLTLPAVSYLTDRERNEVKLTWQLGKTPESVANRLKWLRGTKP